MLVRSLCSCVFQREDDDGRVGVELNRDLVKVAGKALEANLTRLGPLVLPLSEKVKFAWNIFLRKVVGQKVSPYVPDFKKAFKHFCLHAGSDTLLFYGRWELLESRNLFGRAFPLARCP